jgi:hypothetical protein
MKIKDSVFVVLETGGADFPPIVIGVFQKEALAKIQIKEAMTKFIETYTSGHPLITKEEEVEETGNHTRFFIFESEEDYEYNVYLNVFVLAEIHALRG